MLLGIVMVLPVRAPSAVVVAVDAVVAAARLVVPSTSLVVVELRNQKVGVLARVDADLPARVTTGGGGCGRGGSEPDGVLLVLRRLRRLRRRGHQLVLRIVLVVSEPAD